jgi:hypothetical protein
MERKIAPEKNLDPCCSQYSLHHEARDFVRAVMLHLINQLEKYTRLQSIELSKFYEG